MLQFHQASEALQSYHVVVADVQILKVILRHIEIGVCIYQVLFSASSNTSYVFLQCSQKTSTGVTLPWDNNIKSFSVQTLLLNVKDLRAHYKCRGRQIVGKLFS